MPEIRLRKPVFLLGFMGAGKTTLGKKVAAKLGLPFLDLDEALAQQHGQTVAAMFQEVGEAVFRQREREALLQLAEFQGIVSLGGGTPCYADNMEWLLQHGYTVYLQLPVGMLQARLSEQRGDRPLLAHVPETELYAHIGRLLLEREAFYGRAHAIVAQPDVKKLSELISFAARHGALGDE